MSSDDEASIYLPGPSKRRGAGKGEGDVGNSTAKKGPVSWGPGSPPVLREATSKALDRILRFEPGGMSRRGSGGSGGGGGNNAIGSPTAPPSTPFYTPTDRVSTPNDARGNGGGGGGGSGGGGGGHVGGGAGAVGKAVQVDPIKPTLKAAGTKRLKLKYDGTAFKFCFQFQFAPLHIGRPPPFAESASASQEDMSLEGIQAWAYTRPLFSST